ncbi:MAG: cyclic nucleotide-binding domain-containing protein, partial [Salegentibacter sp.]
MKNTIAARIADFLQEFPPFDLIDEAQLLSISEEVKVIYLEKGKQIFKKGEKGHNQFYVVNKGAVALQKEENGESETVDECDEGDIFGLRPLFAQENYMLSAKTEEESILYGIPI